MNKKSYKIIGAMSGTSIDGLDLVYVNFEKMRNGTIKFYIQLHMNILKNGLKN